MASVQSIRCVNPRLDFNPHLGFSRALWLSLPISKLKNPQLGKLVVSASSAENGVGFNDKTAAVANPAPSAARSKYDSAFSYEDCVWVNNM